MDGKLFLDTISYQHNSERKHPNGHRDVKRKLSFISKRIGDFQHQRKFMYKNSSKVKRVIHNQVNQIIKCLRVKERSLWADVDAAYIAQEEYISEELSKLQSVYARCQTLLEHLDDNKAAVDLLDNIYSSLAEAKLEEKQDIKALEFLSDFETLKSMANSFGHLKGGLVKKDEFVFVNTRENNTSNPVWQELHDKNNNPEKHLTLPIVETGNPQNEHSNLSESEDSFEIVDLLDSMCCEDAVNDSAMAEQKISENSRHQEDFIECLSETKFHKTPNGIENFQKALKSNDFNPEEEWKQIFEMRNKIANFSGISESSKNRNCETQNTVSNYFNTAHYHDRNSKQNSYLALEEADNWLCDKSSQKEKHDKNYEVNKFLFLKETDSWLHNKNAEEDVLKEKIFEKSNTELNCDSSPAELIRQAFSSYLTKDSIHNWLLYN